MIQIKKVLGKGRGIFTTEAIPALTVVCVSPVTGMQSGALDGTPLENHCWTHHDGRDYITWGVQSLLNHADEPNCISVLYKEMDLLIALKPIQSGEELTVDYTYLS